MVFRSEDEKSVIIKYENKMYTNLRAPFGVPIGARDFSDNKIKNKMYTNLRATIWSSDQEREISVTIKLKNKKYTNLRATIWSSDKDCQVRKKFNCYIKINLLVNIGFDFRFNVSLYIDEIDLLKI